MRSEDEVKLRDALKRYGVETETINISNINEFNAFILKQNKTLHLAHIYDCCAPEIGRYSLFCHGCLILSIPDEVAVSLRSLK